MRKQITLLLSLLPALAVWSQQTDLGQAQNIHPRDGETFVGEGPLPVFMTMPVVGADYYCFTAFLVMPGQTPAEAIRNNHYLFMREHDGSVFDWPIDIEVPQNATVVWVVQAKSFMGNGLVSAPTVIHFSDGTVAMYAWEEILDGLWTFYSGPPTAQDCRDISDAIDALLSEWMAKALAVAELETQANALRATIAKADADIAAADQAVNDCDKTKNEINDRREQIARDLAAESGGNTQPSDGNCPGESYAGVNMLGNVNFGGLQICVTDAQVPNFLDKLEKYRKELNDLAKKAKECDKAVANAEAARAAAEAAKEQATEELAVVEFNIAECEAEIEALQEAINELLALEDICPIEVEFIQGLQSDLRAVVEHLLESPITESTFFDIDGDLTKADSLLDAAGDDISNGLYSDAKDKMAKVDSLISVGIEKDEIDDCMWWIRGYLDELFEDITDAKNAAPGSDYSDAVDAYNNLNNEYREAREAMEAGDYSKAKKLCDKANLGSDGVPRAPSVFIDARNLFGAIVCEEGATRIAEAVDMGEIPMGSLRLPEFTPPLRYFGRDIDNFDDLFKAYPTADDVPEKIETPLASNVEGYFTIWYITAHEVCDITEVCIRGEWVEQSRKCSLKNFAMTPETKSGEGNIIRGVPIGQDIETMAADGLRVFIARVNKHK